MHAPGNHSLDANRRYLLLVLLFAIALYVVVPQLGDFRASGQLLHHPVLSWTLAAVSLSGLTYLFAALTYWWLAFKPLPYPSIVLIQLAAMFMNRLLPAGIGALGINYVYLRHTKHTTAQATTVMAINNFLGAAGHTLLVVVALAVVPARSHPLPATSGKIFDNLAIILTIGAVMLLGLLLVFGRKRLKHLVADLLSQVFAYRYRLGRLPAALLSSVLLTLSNVLGLGCCALALGVHLPFVACLLIFTFGVGTGTASPTPGGLGGFEAGLTAGFIAYHVAASTALAVALLYRLVSYWLPLLAGGLALIIAQRRRLLVI
jgi:undecaprenyl-diphosphatase